VEEYVCGMCDEELPADLNMGACMCGKYMVLCQGCATWSENKQEWFCDVCIIHIGDDEVSPLLSLSLSLAVCLSLSLSVWLSHTTINTQKAVMFVF